MEVTDTGVWDALCLEAWWGATEFGRDHEFDFGHV